MPYYEIRETVGTSNNCNNINLTGDTLVCESAAIVAVEGADMTMHDHEQSLRLYVGCSLTHASPELKNAVAALKIALRAQGYEVFVGTTAGTARQVYAWDIGHCIADCDIFIAVCDEASIGVGWELAEAVRRGKRCLAVAHTASRVTRLVSGAAEIEPNLHFARYDDLATDVPRLINELVAS